MKKKHIINPYLIIGSILLTLFIVFTILLKVVDVKDNIEGLTIGFYSFNHYFFNLIGVNLTLDLFSDLLFYLTLASACGVGVIASIQLIKRKSLLKVDVDLLTLLVSFGLLVAIYIFFEVVVINYRPIEPEASYPSSHVFLSTFILLSLTHVVRYMIDDNHRVIRNIVITLIYVVLGLLVIFRIMSGAHWMSDILGALMLSSGLYFLYLYFTNLIKRN